MDLTLSLSLVLLMVTSAISSQLPGIDSTDGNMNQILEKEALHLPSFSSDVSNTALNNKEDIGKMADVSRSTSRTTPPTMRKVVKSSSRKAARRSRRRSSRRSRRRTKTSTRAPESAHATTQRPHRDRSEILGQTVNDTASSKGLTTSKTVVKVTTSSPPEVFGHTSSRITRKGSNITKQSAQEINKSPETPKKTYGEPDITTKHIASKQTEHTFLEATTGISGLRTFSTTRTETENLSSTPYHNETGIEVKDDSQSDVISFKQSHSPKSVGDSLPSSVTKKLYNKTFTTHTASKTEQVISKPKATNLLNNMINKSKIGTTDASADIITDTLTRNISSSRSQSRPFNMANSVMSSPMEHVETTPAADSVISPTLRQLTHETITTIPRQGPVPLVSFLSRVLPYLAGILGSRHIIVQRIRPPTVVRGNEDTFSNPRMPQLSRRRHFSIQSIPVRLNFAMLNDNIGHSSASFLMRGQMDIYRQRALCSKTPLRLRKECEDNTECPRKMECYSGKCCATSFDHAEMLDKMLELMDRRRSQRYRMRQ